MKYLLASLVAVGLIGGTTIAQDVIGTGGKAAIYEETLCDADPSTDGCDSSDETE